jgi:hypothetical protein
MVDDIGNDSKFSTVSLQLKGFCFKKNLNESTGDLKKKCDLVLDGKGTCMFKRCNDVHVLSECASFFLAV